MMQDGGSERHLIQHLSFRKYNIIMLRPHELLQKMDLK